MSITASVEAMGQKPIQTKNLARQKDRHERTTVKNGTIGVKLKQRTANAPVPPHVEYPRGVAC